MWISMQKKNLIVFSLKEVEEVAGEQSEKIKNIIKSVTNDIFFAYDKSDAISQTLQEIWPEISARNIILSEIDAAYIEKKISDIEKKKEMFSTVFVDEWQDVMKVLKKNQRIMLADVLSISDKYYDERCMVESRFNS